MSMESKQPRSATDHGEMQNLLGNQLKILVRLNILNLTKHGQKFKEPVTTLQNGLLPRVAEHIISVSLITDSFTKRACFNNFQI